MGRFTGYPKDYNPRLILTLRVNPEGGPLRKPGQILGDSGVFSRRECLVLVHGFNNHAGEAAIAYRGFRTKECFNFEDLSREMLEKILGDAYWPGDAEWPGLVDMADFLVYPHAVRIARDAGPELADLLRRFIKLDRIHLVGHSLGCRVILEALEHLRQSGYPLSCIARVCLMAAAVPVEMVADNGRFAPLLDELGAAGTKVLVLHSAQDTVLHYTFGLGQTAAGQGEGVFPTALGRFGPPPGMHGVVFNEKIEGADHCDYWGWKDTPASLVATGAVGDFIKLGDRPREHKSRDFRIRQVSWVRDAAKNEW